MGGTMDNRLQKIVDETRVKYGLENYQLGTYEIYKERDTVGKAYYQFAMEWYPLATIDTLEEDYNPDGTAIITYHIQKQQFIEVTFVQRESYATITQFTNQSADAVLAWVKEEVQAIYDGDLRLVDQLSNYFRFETHIEGISMVPGLTVEVEFDDLGKLIRYATTGLNETGKAVQQSTFALTLEEIEPLIKAQLQLIHYPSEEENCFKPIYVIEEIFIDAENPKHITRLDQAATKIELGEVLEWSSPSMKELREEEIPSLYIATADEAFGNVDVDIALQLTKEQVEQSKVAVSDALSIVHPEDSGLWRLENLQYERDLFITAHCVRNDSDDLPFKQKIVVFLNPDNLSVIHLVDNGALFEMMQAFEPAKEASITHAEAYEKLAYSIGLMPTYVYDVAQEAYVLCGLLDASDGVDAVTGEVISLMEL